ncbi:MAG: homocysteine S-methyltransferase family protein [Clostridium sp.]
MVVKEFIKENILLFDGAMGTMLQNKGLKLGGIPEELNFTNYEMIKDIHKEYIEAGCNVITLNTFGANRKKLESSEYSTEDIIKSAFKIAKDAIGDNKVYVAQDVGPIGELLEPMGTLSFDEAYEIFKEQVLVGKELGVDVFLVETMTDLYEAKAAILAIKENLDIPVFCTMSFEANGRTFTGCTPSSMAITLEGLGVDAVGVNCSLGPNEILPIIQEITKWTNIDIMVQPNAGLPKLSMGKEYYDISVEEFRNGIDSFIQEGVSIVGGCCGTTPEYIKSLRDLINDSRKIIRDNISNYAVCTPSKTVLLNGVNVIGERINPTGKKLFKEALKNNNMDYILKQGIEQVDAGADILDVNVGLPEIDEVEMMKKVVTEIQSILDTPLQIDSTDSKVIENGLRYYNGKAIVNSVNGEDAVLERILPIVKKYGAAVVGLTLDDNGIPKTAEERFIIAEKILNKAIEYGIKKEDVYIDTLTLTASAQQEEVIETLKALTMVRDRLGLKTVLGVSNISFGLPNRALINESFLTLALSHGLTMPILNPNAAGMMNAIRAYRVLYNIDKGSKDYIETFVNAQPGQVVSQTSSVLGLKDIVIKGIKEEAASCTREMLKDNEELDIVENYLIPALDVVGDKYDKGELFLPQLIQSAETVKKAFEVLKESLLSKNSNSISKGKIILATVKGDIHDIGKNIVKVILENYGYDIIDLGKDVPIEKVVEEAKKQNVTLVGLSALMTTTLKSMEETIKALDKELPHVQTLVGGAVLTPEYAEMIGADYYARDARESVEIARRVLG